MYRRSRVGLFAGSIFLAVAAALVQAEVRLPHVIGSHMVLQRDMAVPIWGWADPGERVTVKIAGQEAAAVTDDQGRWTVRLKAIEAGGPHEMTVTGKNTIQLADILVGEVWVCSGQSNMEMAVRQANNAEQEVAAADFPQIRLLTVPHLPTGEPADDFDGQWVACDPKTVGGFSAAGYFFGRHLHQELKVPIGLIHSSWGGTRIEPWTPAEAFVDEPIFKEIRQQIAEAAPQYKKAVGKALPRFEAWLPKARQALDSGQPVPPPPQWPSHPLASHVVPTGLYNGMIHPLVPFAIRGAIWYQGESNHADGAKYTEMMKALIGGWRRVWSQGDFAFYYVQIAPYGRLYAGDLLPRLWEAQTAAMSIPNTGMIVTTDIADLNDIHPTDKQDVGKRLALWALAKTYGRQDVVCSGPLYKSMKIEGDKIRLSFDYVGGGLASRDGQPLTWFEIAGDDQQFVKAEAKIDGDTVVVRSDQVRAPVAVRFGWNLLAQPNLMNKEGLPASPFRTDRW